MMPTPLQPEENTPAEPDREVRLLGEALGARVEDVVARAAQRGREGGMDALVPAIAENFERIGRGSTAAVARWMAGGKPEAGLETGREAWHTYGQLAAQNAAPLNEVTKRCLRWRDAVIEVLHERAEELHVSFAALATAASMVQRTLDVTLVRMCEAFEQERARITDELTRRDEELMFMTTHDALTGLPNRTLILDRGEQMLVRARRHETPVAALLIDLDNFTGINDTLGHVIGDELLQAIAARASSSSTSWSCCRTSAATAARASCSRDHSASRTPRRCSRTGAPAIARRPQTPWSRRPRRSPPRTTAHARTSTCSAAVPSHSACSPPAATPPEQRHQSR